MTNKSGLLLIEGNVQGSARMLSGKSRTADGKGMVRGTWEPAADVLIWYPAAPAQSLPARKWFWQNYAKWILLRPLLPSKVVMGWPE